MYKFDDPRGANNVGNLYNSSSHPNYVGGLPMWVIKYGVIGFFVFWFVGLVL